MAGRLIQKLRSAAVICLGGTGFYVAINIYKENEKFYSDVIMPTVHRLLNPEQAHQLAVLATKYRILPKSKYRDPNCLHVNFLTLNLTNPLGIAAGFDKHAESVEGLHNLGFGFVEIGSVTPEPQLGNEKPRVFRLAADEAVINRYGFNSEGHAKVLQRLEKLRSSTNQTLIGVNLGKNKLSDDAVADYVEGVKRFAHVADYLVVNISSPNTPGLRLMQQKESLQILLENVIRARNALPQKIPVLLKLAPDLHVDDRQQIAKIIVQPKYRVDGLIISNTTISRENLTDSTYVEEMGGLSGRPLKDISTQMVGQMFKLTGGQIPIIGVGGVFSGKDAYEKIRAGASLVQLYTAFVYYGPPRITRIKRELVELLEKDGFHNVAQAVGVDAESYANGKK